MTAKLPFTDLPGYPAADDPRIAMLMEVHDNLLSPVSIRYAHECTLRALVGWKRTGNIEMLTGFAEAMLLSIRVHHDPGTAADFARSAARGGKPAPAEETFNVEEALRERGLLGSDSR